MYEGLLCVEWELEHKLLSQRGVEVMEDAECATLYGFVVEIFCGGCFGHKESFFASSDALFKIGGDVDDSLGFTLGHNVVGCYPILGRGNNFHLRSGIHQLYEGTREWGVGVVDHSNGSVVYYVGTIE